MTEHEDVVGRLRNADYDDVDNCMVGVDIDDCHKAAEIIQSQAEEIERLRAALTAIAADAYVSVVGDKPMYRGWRKSAAERIDIACTALEGKG